MIECNSCGFNLATLPATLQIKPADGALKQLTCPFCSQSVELRVADYGVLVRGSGAATSFARWKLSAKDETGTLLRIDRLSLRFDVLGSIEPREVCYPRVPAFLDENGDIAYPDVPLRTSCFDCFDEKRARAYLESEPRLWEVVGTQYQAVLHLKGLLDPVRVTLQTLTPDGGPPSVESCYRELNLRIWPNLNVPSWAFYLVGLAGSGPFGDALLEGRRVRALARGPNATAWVPMSVVQRRGAANVQAFSERPSFVAIEVVGAERAGDAEGGVLGGGLFLVRDTLARPIEGPQVEIGLDFGTSNTCVALKGFMTTNAAEPELLRRFEPDVGEKNWSLYLLRGGPESKAPAGPDLWPSPYGFGEFGDVIPSEILFPSPTREMGPALGGIERWQFGIDYGIPSSGVAPQFPEAEYVLGDFKWRAMVQAASPVFFPRVEQLQTHYLTAVLMIAFVRAAVTSGQVAKSASVLYSFPMSFEEAELTTLRSSAEAAAARLKKLTGVGWNAAPGVDESVAAARNAGTTGANVLVYLDMGGGSTDIAVKLVRGNRAEDIYLTSVAYAGSALLNGFAGVVDPHTSKVTGSCLAGKTTLDTLRRRVREARFAKDVIGDSTLFNTAFSRVVQSRIRHFYDYLIEYVARLIAAGFLDQRFRENPQEEGPPKFPEAMAVSFFFLGNGWGFANHQGSDTTNAISRQIIERAGHLVQREKLPYAVQVSSRLKGVKITYEVGKLRRVPHSKSAVALGLLAETQRSLRKDDDAAEMSRLSILGWNTRVDGREIPWFVLCSNGALPSSPGTGPARPSGGGTFVFGADSAPASDEYQTPWYVPLKGAARLDWENASPALPDTLEQPFDLDKGLNGTRGALRVGCVPDNNEWFVKGAYEVMLETLFKPKLREIT